MRTRLLLQQVVCPQSVDQEAITFWMGCICWPFAVLALKLLVPALRLAGSLVLHGTDLA